MTIPYLIEQTPYTYQGTVCQSIDDMVSINLQQRTPVQELQYNISSQDDVEILLSVKNITNNTSLELVINFEQSAFKIYRDNWNGVSAIILPPNTTTTFVIKLNKAILDSSVTDVLSNIELSVKNIVEGQVTTKDDSVSRLDLVFLDDITTA